MPFGQHIGATIVNYGCLTWVVSLRQRKRALEQYSASWDGCSPLYHGDFVCRRASVLHVRIRVGRLLPHQYLWLLVVVKEAQ